MNIKPRKTKFTLQEKLAGVSTVFGVFGFEILQKRHTTLLRLPGHPEIAGMIVKNKGNLLITFKEDLLTSLGKAARAVRGVEASREELLCLFFKGLLVEAGYHPSNLTIIENNTYYLSKISRVPCYLNLSN